MKKNILLLLIFASVIFATATSCSKDGIKDKDNGMVKVTFGTPSSTTPKYVVGRSCTGSTVSLSSTDFSYDVSKIGGGSVSSGNLPFGTVKNFELSPGTYHISALVKYHFTGTTFCAEGNFDDNNDKEVLIEKGKVTEITVY